MFKSLTSPLYITEASTVNKPRGFIIPPASEEFELHDDDGQKTESWTSSRQMELECWKIYHTYARRFRQLEILEKFGTIESISDDGSDGNTGDDEGKQDHRPSTKRQKSKDVNSGAKGVCVEGHSSDSDSERNDQRFSCSSFLSFHEKEDITILANRLLLRRDKHLQWLFRSLGTQAPQKISLDASRAWIVFWITQAIGLLNGWDNATTEQLELRTRIVPFMSSLENPFGGYGGGPRQLSHLAPTYAAVSSLINVGTEEAFASIDRHAIYNFIKRMRDPINKGFHVHEDGELDVRGAYCAVSVASMLHIVTDELFEGIEDYIRSLQSFDGGLSGEPGLESHGGYTYCGLASLMILGKQHLIDLDQLLFWVVSRQSDTCGGFNGRPNKLTDSCYSFWCSGVLALFDRIGYVPLSRSHPHSQATDDQPHPNTINNPNHCWFDHVALQLYILSCCQEGEEETIYTYKGGLRDKPGASPDYYHSCYSLSGLSLSQHTSPHPIVVGPSISTNLLRQTDPFYNVEVGNVEKALSYFSKIPFVAPSGQIGTEGAGVVGALKRQV